MSNFDFTEIAGRYERDSLVQKAAAEVLISIAINTIPITPGIPYHTIMGDRGKGDAPNSSDGIVPYWSSHMQGAKSELSVG